MQKQSDKVDGDPITKKSSNTVSAQYVGGVSDEESEEERERGVV